MGSEQSRFLSTIDDAEGDAVFRTVAGAVEELAFCEDGASCGLGERFDEDEWSVADGAFYALTNLFSGSVVVVEMDAGP